MNHLRRDLLNEKKAIPRQRIAGAEDEVMGGLCGFAKKASGKHQERGLPHYSSKSLLLQANGGSFEKCHTYLAQVSAIATGRGEDGVAALAEHRLFQLNQVKARHAVRPAKRSIDTSVEPA